jgi:hypothetical protein
MPDLIKENTLYWRKNTNDMNSAIKRIFCLYIFIIPFIASAQVTIYRTFDDFENEHGEALDKYIGYMHMAGSVKLTFEKDGHKKKIHCRDMWGFRIGDDLFRIDKRYNQPTKVVSVGKICYYKNGIMRLEVIRARNKNAKKVVHGSTLGYYNYVSKSLNSDLLSLNGRIGQGKVDEFKTQYPEYTTLLECIEERSYTNVRPCIEEFEK